MVRRLRNKTNMHSLTDDIWSLHAALISLNETVHRHTMSSYRPGPLSILVCELHKHDHIKIGIRTVQG